MLYFITVQYNFKIASPGWLFAQKLLIFFPGESSLCDVSHILSQAAQEMPTHSPREADRGRGASHNSIYAAEHIRHTHLDMFKIYQQTV